MTKAKITHTIVRRSIQLPVDYDAMLLNDKTPHSHGMAARLLQVRRGPLKDIKALKTWGSEASPRTGDKPPPPQGSGQRASLMTTTSSHPGLRHIFTLSL